MVAQILNAERKVTSLISSFEKVTQDMVNKEMSVKTMEA